MDTLLQVNISAVLQVRMDTLLGDSFPEWEPTSSVHETLGGVKHRFRHSFDLILSYLIMQIRWLIRCSAVRIPFLGAGGRGKVSPIVNRNY